MPDIQALLSAIDKAEAGSYGSDNNGDLSTIRARSIEDYLGEPYGDEVDGQSQVVSRDVFDTVESIKPSLARIFTGGDRVCKFDPVGPEDEEQAEQETDYINHVIQEKNQWFQIFYEWSHDALTTKNAYAMAYFDRSTEIEPEKYFGLSDEEFALLMQDQEVELVAHSAYPGMMGIEHDAEVKRTRTKGQVKICVLPPERCKVDENTPNFSVKGSNYFEYWDLKTLSEIREMGLQISDQALKAGGGDGDKDTPEDAARDGLGETRGDDASEESMTRHKVRMIWIRHDYNGDGIAELCFCIRINKEIPYLEEINTIPVASIVPIPLPHRHMGLSVRDIVTDLQRINTELWRQSLNNMYLANNGRYGISDKVNLDDMLVSRAGGVVRVNGVPANEIFPFQHPFIAQHAITMMDYTDQRRENRTGMNRYFNGSDQGAVNKTASGIAQLSSQASQRMEMIARIFAEGVKDLFQIVHELTIKHADASRPDKVRLRNKWVPIDPSGWKKRTDLKIAVGMGTGNKEVVGANLLNIAGLQEKAMPLGLVKPQHAFHTLSEITKNYGFPNPNAFWQEPPAGADWPQPSDPRMEKVKADAAAKAQQQSIDAQQDAAEMERDMRMEQFKAMLDTRMREAEQAREADFQRWKSALDAQTKVIVAEITAGATVSAAQVKGADEASRA